MQNIEKDMERRLKDLKETERKERLRALQKQAENLEYELFQSQKEDREWQDRMRETQILKDRIAKKEIGVLSHEHMLDFSVYDTSKLKYQETDKSRFLEEESKRRESVIKLEMLNGAQGKICVDKDTINVENQHKEEQIRMHFEKE